MNWNTQYQRLLPGWFVAIAVLCWPSSASAHLVTTGMGPANAVSALAVVVGLVHGFFNGAALKQGAGTLGLLGIMVMLFVLTALVCAFVVSLKKPWTRIAVRVMGSWIAASGLLLLGWSLRAGN